MYFPTLHAATWVETLASELSPTAVLLALSRPPTFQAGMLRVSNGQHGFPATPQLLRPVKKRTPFYDEEELLLEFLERFGQNPAFPQIVLEAYRTQLRQGKLTSMVMTMKKAIATQPYCQLVASAPMNGELTRTVLEFTHLASKQPSLVKLLVCTVDVETEEQWDLLCRLRNFCGTACFKRLPKMQALQVKHGTWSWEFQWSLVSIRYKSSSVYETQQDRLIWVSVYFALARRKPEQVLPRAPPQLLIATALLPF